MSVAMTNQSPESVIAEVIEYHADTIGSHWDGCYKHHAVCLAVKLQDMLRGSGVPDTQRRAVRELIAEARGFWGSETREYAEGLVSRLADALEAQQVDENVMDEEASYDWCCATCGGKERVRGAFMSVGQNHNCLETDETRQVDEAKLAEVAERDAANAAIARVRALETFSITDSYPAWTAVDHDDLLAALDGAPDNESLPNHCQSCGAWGTTKVHLRGCSLDGAPEPDTITIPRPVVPFGPVSKTENEATADYLLEVVKKIDGKYCAVGGSNVTATVRKLLVDAADAVRGLPVEGEKP